ncbi:MAG: rhamnulokinase [Lentisphaerae bacterium]|nr:rhamnulokinase [Lentisphaerota bacterium]
MKNFLAFDLGASSGRAIIGTVDNGKLTMQEVHRFANGPTEIDGSFYWDYPRLCNELKTGLRNALATGVKLDGISIDTWGVDYVFFDKDTGKMRRLPYNYRDLRTVAAAEKVWQKISKAELYNLTGIQCMTLNTIYQLCAHYEEHPEDFENSFFLPIPDALALSLGGDATAEYTFCSTTNLLDPVSRQWHWDLIARLGLPKEVFPEIVAAGTPSGMLSAELCAELGCDPIPIFKCGSHDTASAVAAVPAPVEGQWAYLSAGTWALLGAEIDQPLMTAGSEKESITNEGGVGGKIRFLTNIMGSWLFQELRRVWNEEGKNLSFNDMEQMARRSEPCKYFINPNCAEFAAPGDMPGNIRAFLKRTGQGENFTDAEVVRAVYDSLALYFANKIALLEKLLNVKYACLNVVGGGTKDGFLMELAASALDRQVVAGPIEATAAGNILVQAMAAGELASLDDVRKVIRASFELKTFVPDAAMAAGYAAQAARFAAIAGK